LIDNRRDLERLNSMYLKLNNEDRRIIIRLVEGLFNSQNIIEDRKIESREKKMSLMKEEIKND